MSLLIRQYLDAGSPAAPSYAAYPWTSGLTDPTTIINQWRRLNNAYTEAVNNYNALSARIGALQTGASGGGLAAFAALQLGPSNPAVDVQLEVVREFYEASGIATAGTALLSAVQAATVTPLQTSLAAVNSAYNSTLHGAGLI